MIRAKSRLESVNQRNLLEKKALDDEDYIRPILLIQAMQKGQSPSPEEVKTYLTETLKIPAVQIAIATGSQKDLDGVDLFDQKTPIRYVITIKALKEGWDCSFAYVLCSLQHIHSAKDVEQLLGRIMRMPYAKKRTVQDLNRAYADVVSTSTYVAANRDFARIIFSGNSPRSTPPRRGFSYATASSSQ